MSHKVRLEDLSTENLDEMDNDFFITPATGRQKKGLRKARKRKMIEDYMEERSLKRNLTESYDLY
ncbi:hypothetical protein Q4488_17170 [Amphritea sp. 1_MG-2023]|uniref:PA3496 family putative envelope integrity protein n=1 Tax=Amphritea sp. 1_MG-2023 TaxID=3062670 RepID=UPI0026E29D2D|nr:hypothetical protein [Amphritea sp. 1_MG-2023]MDO6565110.1 hypothetical protein [Amphritea sp. 1_MG-2023]